VAAILVLCLFVRAYRLSEQSLWYDDFNSVCYLNAPDLSTYLQIMRVTNMQSVPLYYILQYAVGCVAGAEAVPLRMISVLFSLAACGLLWLVARRAGGTRAAHVAALLFALSPFYLWYGQATRPYAMQAFLAMASIYALLRAQDRTGWNRWWVFNVLLNTAVVWTHMFGVFLILWQGLALLFFKGIRHRPLWQWGSFQFALLMPSLLWIGAMPFISEASYSWYHPATFTGLLQDLFADDSVLWSVELMESGATWPFLSPDTAEALHRLILPASGFIALLMAVAAGATLLRLRRKSTRTFSDILAVCLALGPTLSFEAISFVWRPCIFPRYAMYSSALLYIFIGVLLSRIRVRAYFAFILAAVVAAYAVQLSFMMPAATRTDWIGACDHIKAHAQPGDLVVVGTVNMPPVINAFRWHMKQTSIPSRAAYTRQAILECARTHLLDNPDSTAWVVCPRNYEAGPPPDLETALQQAGLSFTPTYFVALENLYVCEVRNSGQITPGIPLVPAQVDYLELLREAGATFASDQERETALAALRRIVDRPLPKDQLTMASISTLLSDQNLPALAMTFARRAIALDPEYALGSFAEGLAYVALNDRDKAHASFAHAAALGGDSAILTGFGLELARAWKEGGTEALASQVEKIGRMGVYTPDTWRKAAGLEITTCGCGS
jgi:uncharacterized membrane protein